MRRTCPRCTHQSLPSTNFSSVYILNSRTCKNITCNESFRECHEQRLFFFEKQMAAGQRNLLRGRRVQCSYQCLQRHTETGGPVQNSRHSCGEFLPVGRRIARLLRPLLRATIAGVQLCEAAARCRGGAAGAQNAQLALRSFERRPRGKLQPVGGRIARYYEWIRSTERNASLSHT